MAATTMPTAATTEKAAWWTRFFAVVIDIIAIVVSRGDTTGASGLQTLLGLAYFVYFWSSYGKGQTPGMRALNIKVIKTDGSQLDLVGAFIRYIGFFISVVCLFIGVIWAAFDGQKQGLHDK